MLSSRFLDANGSEASRVDYVYRDGATGDFDREAERTETEQSAQSNRVTTSTFDTQGNATTVTNALGQVSSWSQYNGLGQAGRVVNVNGVATDFSYDARSNLKTATQRVPTGDRLTSYTYTNSRQVLDMTCLMGV